MAFSGFVPTPGLLVYIDSKAERGNKYFVCVSFNDEFGVLKMMYASTDRGDEYRFNCPIECDRLPMTASDTEWAVFSFDNFARYKSNDFQRRFIRDHGLLPVDVAKDLKKFCKKVRRDMPPKDFRDCIAMFDAVIDPPVVVPPVTVQLPPGGADAPDEETSEGN